MIYVDQTNTINHSFTTGIPRVSRTIARLASEDKAEIVCFGSEGYFHAKGLAADYVYSEVRTRKLLEDFLKTCLSISPKLYRIIQEKYLSHRVSKLGKTSRYLGHQELAGSTIILPEIPSKKRALFLVSNSIKLDLRIVFWVYDLLPYTHPQYFKKSSILDIQIFENLLRVSAKVIVNSAHVKSEILRIFPNFPSSKIKVIPLPSSFSKLSDKGVSSESVRSFLMIGSLEPRKNHLLAIKGFLKLSKEFPRTELNFIYNNSWKSWKVFVAVFLLKCIGKKIYLHKNLKDFEVLRYLEESTALLFLSFEEGYGLPVVEALSIGVPVIMLEKPPMSEFADLGGIIWCENTSSGLLKSMLILHDEIERKETISGISVPERLQNWTLWWKSYGREVLGTI